jgi:hypothetical protein
MGTPNLDLTRLYFGDYVGDTMDLTADQHAIFQKLLLQLWLQRPVDLKAKWLRITAFEFARLTRLLRARCIVAVTLKPRSAIPLDHSGAI